MSGAVERSVIRQVQSNLEYQNYHVTEGTIINIETIYADVTGVSYTYKIVGYNPLTRIINQVAISIFMSDNLASRDVADIAPSA